MKVGIVYYSSTGNTEAMAKLFEKNLKELNVEGSVIEADNFKPDDVESFDRLLFGCAAAGSEELDDDTFLPMWESVVPVLGDKKIGLFGSHDWGDGEWIETWQEDAEEKGLTIVGTAIANLEPDDEAEVEIKALAEAIIK